MKEAKEKSKALGLAIEKLEKTYGQGTIMKLSDENIVKIPSIPTGSLQSGYSFRNWWTTTGKSCGNIWARIIW